MVEVATAPEVVQNPEVQAVATVTSDAVVQEAYDSAPPAVDTSQYAQSETIVSPAPGGESTNNSQLDLASPYVEGSAAVAADSSIPVDSPAGRNADAVPTVPSELDASQSPTELVDSGAIVQGEVSADVEVPPPLEEGKAPRIQVTKQESQSDETPGDAASPPNFVVHHDGTIEMFVDPEGPPPVGTITIQVEPTDNVFDNKPPAIQQKSVDLLVDYLAQRIVEQYEDVLPKVANGEEEISAVDIRDKQNLVGNDVEHRFGSNLPPQQGPADGGFPSGPGTGGGTNIGGGFSGGGGPSDGGGSMGGDGSGTGGSMDTGNSGNGDQSVDNRPTYPQRSVPRPEFEADPIAGIKETVAAYAGADPEDPYNSIRETPGLGYQIGRYGLSQQTIGDWIGQYLPADILELLGQPPDWSKLSDILKRNPELMKKFQSSMKEALQAEAKKWSAEGSEKDSDALLETAKTLEEFSKNFDNAEFSDRFVEFVGNTDGLGSSITKDDVSQLLPPEMQEIIASGAAEKIASDLGVQNIEDIGADDAAKVALGFLLGRTPEAEDLKSDAGSKFIESSSAFYTEALKHLPTEVQVDMTFTDPANAYNIANGNFGEVQHIVPLNPAGKTNTVEDRQRWYLFQGEVDNKLNGIGNWFSCGSTSLAMTILNWSGASLTEQQKTQVQLHVINTTNSLKEGQFAYGVEGMANFARYYGLSASTGVGAEQLLRDLDSGKSVIADNPGAGAGHIISIQGRDENDNYIVGDPSYPGTVTWTRDQVIANVAAGGWGDYYTAVWR